MHSGWSVLTNTLAAGNLVWLGASLSVVKVVIGFSVIIFVHELGHFLAAKWAGIRVDRFAIGFGYRLFGWRRGEGMTLGKRPNYTAEEQQARNYGETDYCVNVLPFGGYVKMLGQDDIVMNDETGEIRMSDDPRAFTNKPVGKRMVVASAGVLFNVLFAIVVYAIVFMSGYRELPPKLGAIGPSTPAGRAGLMANDVVLSVNGEKCETFRDVGKGFALAEDGTAVVRVERNGQRVPEPFVVHIPQPADNPILASGLSPARTSELLDLGEFLKQCGDLRPHDRIAALDGHPVNSSADFIRRFDRYVTGTGAAGAEVTAVRPNSDNPAETSTIKTYLPSRLDITAKESPGTLESKDLEDILGLDTRCLVDLVTPDQPAERAGIRSGDVIARWGAVPNPLYGEIVESIKENDGRAIPVVVERNGQRVELSVTPERPFKLFGEAKAQVGILFGHEARRPIVANISEGSPASALNLPRGSLIVAIDGTPVRDWFDVVRLLRAAAGKTVSLTYRAGSTEADGQMAVPSSIMDALHLPPSASIISIDGKDRVAHGKDVLHLPDAVAVSGLLDQYHGQTVKVEYRLWAEERETHTARFAVAADGSNVDPWQLRVTSGTPLAFMSGVAFVPEEKIVRTSNPLEAIASGTRQTGATIVEMYQVVTAIGKNLVHGDMSTVQHISGPVNIVRAAVERAKLGYVELLTFLAFLSVNLAVINFIPFPVVDGGLMVFLIIEKVKGRPLSLKTQMVATLVGLATIILVFVLVTFKDITHPPV